MWRLWWYYVNVLLMYLNYTREHLMNQTSCAGVLRLYQSGG
jgi:hypothetical protein